jgi:hypothetical protein
MRSTDRSWATGAVKEGVVREKRRPVLLGEEGTGAGGRMDRKNKSPFCAAILAMALAALSSAWAAGASPPNVTGRAIVAVSDGDMLAAAYYDQQLPPTDARVVDTLSITRLPFSGATKPTAVIEPPTPSPPHRFPPLSRPMAASPSWSRRLGRPLHRQPSSPTCRQGGACYRSI